LEDNLVIHGVVLSPKKMRFSNPQSLTSFVNSVGGCDGFYYPLQGNDALLKGQLVFEKEESSRDHNLGLFSVSDYDAERNLYATLKLEKEGRSKQVRLIWMEPK
jgi:hypothetical protein